MKKIVVPILCIALVVGILSGCVEEENVAPDASFTYEPTEGIYVDTEITFTDTSTDTDGTIEEWSWDFGDDETSTDQNPMHSYAAVGTYTVTLIVTDDGGNASEAYTMDITVTTVPPVPPTADFTYDPMEDITTATEITFTDASTKGDANITEWLWDFGDETNSTEQNPTHTFAAAGEYEVTLTVTDEDGETGTATETITVTAPEE
jgi:PKD repeat protein